MARIVTASLVVLAFPVLAAAQRGGGSAAAHFAAPDAHFAAPAPRAAFGAAPRAMAPRASASSRSFGTRASRSAPRVASTGVRNGRTNRRSNGAFFDSDQVDFQDVPGLGFDFPHLAAISGNRHGRSRFNSGFPFGFGGFLLSPSIVVEEPPAEAQSVAPEEAPVETTSADPVERPSRSRARASAPEESLAPPAPQPDAEQYVFVRRDGSLVFAVAYTWDNGSLRYVTPEGFRRTIAPDSLDLAATQQFNEQRGLTFRSPA